MMAAYAAGDPRAFANLFAVFGPKVHGFFMRSFRNPAVADDLLQTTFLKLHRARADFRAELPLRPWVFAIAARVRLDELRKRRRLPEDLDEEGLARAEEAESARASVGADADFEISERAGQVRVALDRLPESQRVIVHLHRFEGMTFAAIAETLGTTEGAVKLRAFRAYQRLRKELLPILGPTTPPADRVATP